MSRGRNQHRSRSGSRSAGSNGEDQNFENTPRYALVKWLSGKEAGTLTHNVETSWILQFDPLVDFREESHVVEWRAPPKPKTGWPMCDCKVLEISDDLDFLKHCMEKAQDSGAASSPKRTPRRSQSQARDEEIQTIFKSFLSQFGGVCNTSSHSQSLPTDEKQVKVGEALTLSNTAYMEAKLARTPSSMTMELVRSAFSKKRLRRSSYAGQKRLVDGVCVQKPSLKKYRKTKDIQNFVLQRFPYFTQSSFGHAVNSVTGSNVDKCPPKKLVDVSDSEESDAE